MCLCRENVVTLYALTSLTSLFMCQEKSRQSKRNGSSNSHRLHCCLFWYWTLLLCLCATDESCQEFIQVHCAHVLMLCMTETDSHSQAGSLLRVWSWSKLVVWRRCFVYLEVCLITVLSWFLLHTVQKLACCYGYVSNMVKWLSGALVYYRDKMFDWHQRHPYEIK